MLLHSALTYGTNAVIVALRTSVPFHHGRRLHGPTHQRAIALADENAPVYISEAQSYPDERALTLAAALALTLRNSNQQAPPRTIVLGHVDDHGSVLSVRALAAMLHAAAQRGYERAIIPTDALATLDHDFGLQLFPVASFSQALSALRTMDVRRAHDVSTFHKQPPMVNDLANIKGQYTAKRALEVAAAGRHHILLIGDQRCGKRDFARCLAGILPPLRAEEGAQYRAVWSAACVSRDFRVRPTCEPIVLATPTDLCGRADIGMPNALAQSHYGVLHLYDLPYMRTDTQTRIADAIHEGHYTLEHDGLACTFDSQPLIVATITRCTPTCRRCQRFGPCDSHIVPELLDLFDISVSLSAPANEDALRQSSDDAQYRVVRSLEHRREHGHSMPIAEDAQPYITRTIERFPHVQPDMERIERIAQTIAHLERAPAVQTEHLCEAASYRSHIYSITARRQAAA